MTQIYELFIHLVIFELQNMRNKTHKINKIT
jgi:hypothetical protein